MSAGTDERFEDKLRAAIVQTPDRDPVVAFFFTPQERDALADALEALRRDSDANDYCVACDCHPSDGHGKNCPIVRLDALTPGRKNT